MQTKPIPSQEEADLNKPDEHFAWAIRNLPMVAGSGLMMFSGFARRWSKHFWDLGFRHRDWLERLADEDGNIHVSKLPKQTLRFQEAFRGPHHTWNPAAQWVTPDTPAPTPYSVPNTKEMTLQEKYALAYQLDLEGIRIPQAHKPSEAEEFND